MNHNYFVYIVTNQSRTALYTGVTNDLARRLWEHQNDSKTLQKTFAGKYKCFYLVYWERFQFIEHAIDGEKEIKGWKRERKNALIEGFNPQWRSLNDEVLA